MKGFFKDVQGSFLEEYTLQGDRPERGLHRLKKVGVTVYNVKKVTEDTLVFKAKRKDYKKIFAIFPNLCYNSAVQRQLTLKNRKVTGLGKVFDFFKKRLSLILGGMLTLAVVLFANQCILGIKFVSNDVYKREALSVLKEYGVQPFSLYQTGNEDMICAKLLKEKYVEFCSIKKEGLWLNVDIRLSPFNEIKKDSGKMYAKHTGVIIGITALSGTPIKKVGDNVVAGECIVENYTQIEGEQRQFVEVVATVKTLCSYEDIVPASTKEEAFSKTYLALNLEKGKIIEKEITKSTTGFIVKIRYETLQSINL